MAFQPKNYDRASIISKMRELDQIVSNFIRQQFGAVKGHRAGVIINRLFRYRRAIWTIAHRYDRLSENTLMMLERNLRMILGRIKTKNRLDADLYHQWVDFNWRMSFLVSEDVHISSR